MKLLDFANIENGNYGKPVPAVTMSMSLFQRRKSRGAGFEIQMKANCTRVLRQTWSVFKDRPVWSVGGDLAVREFRGRSGTGRFVCGRCSGSKGTRSFLMTGTFTPAHDYFQLRGGLADERLQISLAAVPGIIVSTGANAQRLMALSISVAIHRKVSTG